MAVKKVIKGNKGGRPRKDALRPKYCKHIFSDGKRCRGKASPYGLGFCMAHAKELGVYQDPREDRERDEGIEEIKDALKTAQKNDNLASFFKKMRDDLCPVDFDAASEYALLKAESMMEGATNATEKYVLALWMSADPFLRQPSTIDQLGQLLGVSVRTLEIWRRGRDVLDLYDLHRDRWMREKRRLVDIALLGKVLNGDTTAIKLYYELHPSRVKVDEVKKKIDLAIPKALATDVAIIQGDEDSPGIPRDGVSTKLAKKISFKMLQESDGTEQ